MNEALDGLLAALVATADAKVLWQRLLHGNVMIKVQDGRVVLKEVTQKFK